MDFESDEPGFKSWLCLLTAPPSTLSFLICEMGTLIAVPLWGYCED